MDAEPFWLSLGDGGEAPAVLGREGVLSYRALAEAAAEQAQGYRTADKGVVMIGARLDLGGVVRYLGALIAGQAVFLIKPDLEPGDLEALVGLYQPRFLTLPQADGGYLTHRRDGPAYPVHPDLALLLSTSGSVGEPKAVRLSARNLAVNAAQIVEALGIGAHERAALTMPLYYTYGLSVLNSQLKARASVWLDPRTAIDPGLWAELETQGATSFHGVPMTYQLLQRLNRPAGLERLSRLTQAGGRLPEPTTAWLAELSRRAGVPVWKMYGMTEASARIAVLPPERLFDKPDSAGKPVPGGAVEIAPSGEIIYRGPNVMMGYAAGFADLARGDDLAGVLATADSGRLDDQGFLYVHGRMDRTVKLFGLRVDLDFVERWLGAGETAAIFDGERVRVFAASDRDLGAGLAQLARKMQVPAHAFSATAVEALPRTGSGKIDYRRLKEMLA